MPSIALFIDLKVLSMSPLLITNSIKFLTDILPFKDEFLRTFEQSDDVAALDNHLRKSGYHSLEEEGLQLLMAGAVSPEEYIAAVIL